MRILKAHREIARDHPFDPWVTSMEERSSSARNDLWVFRDGRKTVPALSLYRELDLAISELLRGPATQSRIIAALLRAGELESALMDAGLPEGKTLDQLSDALARLLCGDSSFLGKLENLRRSLCLFGTALLTSSPAEGFAYYALHPLDFSRLPDSILCSTRPAVVIGIRSIGTTLSAIVTAALRQKKRIANRITVRPTGHPYERVTRFSDEQRKWIERQNRDGAAFLVVDEGPGRSGSSFLSVGEALVQAGVDASRIVLTGSREVDPQQLCTTNAAARWNAFRFIVPRCYAYERFSNDLYVGGGMWKTMLPGNFVNDVACWPQMERLKFLSRDQRWLFKFEGFGRYGDDVLQRAGALATAGFAVIAKDGGDGMVRYPFVQGRILRRDSISREVLDRMAEYCAFRSAEFTVSEAPPSQLAEMVCFNVKQQFGIDIEVGEQLRCERPVLADGRMHPHEWIQSLDGGLVKVDGCTHGDDHFFPGPTDIAWDLAGAIVEWNLDQEASDYLLMRFQQRSGDGARGRIPSYLLAYSVFRQAYCQMAVSTVENWEERVLLEKASTYYRGWVEASIRSGKSNANVLPKTHKHAPGPDPILPLASPALQMVSFVRDENG